MDRETSREAERLARKNKNILAAVGIHPHNARILDKNQLSWFKEKLDSPRVVALGEIGLDYFYDNSPRSLQKKMLLQFLRLAEITATPVIIHLRPENNNSNPQRCRSIFNDLFALLDRAGGRNLSGVFHCFSGSREELKLSKKYNFYYSAAGNITFPAARGLRKTFQEIPPERLLIETDSPYMSPRGQRGERNNPFRVAEVLEKLSGLYSLPEEVLADKIFKNTNRIFGRQVNNWI